MTNIKDKQVKDRLAMVRGEIARHAQEFGRDANEIQLVAVSKTRPAADVASAFEAGQVDFGENYLQEAGPKIGALEDLGIRWHFIGRIQSNKTRELASRFDWVQTVDRERVATRLNAQRPENLPPLNICLQVNADREAQKAGLDPDHVPALARKVARMQRLRLRGLMAIPAASDDFEAQRQAFLRVRKLYDQLRADGLELDTLSIGMSGDLRAAVAAGSTMVRVGTAIFGPRG
ncbi:MAG TPA: YggS family pyridoxal phosphate-dependent enzyme [Gammaproteobacteria bacterium]